MGVAHVHCRNAGNCEAEGPRYVAELLDIEVSVTCNKDRGVRESHD